MKKWLKVSLCAVCLVAICACAFGCVWTPEDTEKPWLEGKTVEGHPLTYDLTEADVASVAEKMALGKQKCQEEVDYDGFEAIYNELNVIAEKLNVAYAFENVLFNMYGREENQQKYLAYYDVLVDLEQWYNEVEHMAYRNSFKELAYEGMTDEEILEMIGEEYPQEYFDLSKDI